MSEETVMGLGILFVIFIIVFAVAGGFVLEEYFDTPHEDCIDVCHYNFNEDVEEKLLCVQECNKLILNNSEGCDR